MKQVTLNITRRGGYTQATILTNAFDGFGFHGLGTLHAINGWQLTIAPCGGYVWVAY